VTVDGKKKLSILQPMADAYEPSTEEGQRVFRKLQATLYEGAPSSPERALPVNAMTFLGLCCVAGVLALGSMVYGRHASGPASDTMSKENVADVSSPKLASSGTSREGDIQLPESLGDSDNSVPCVAVDDLPELVGTAPTQAMPIPARSRPPIAIASAAVEESTLEREARLIAGADSALRDGDAPRALALLDEHARLFPQGWLASDRAGERVLVLCALGQHERAIREAEAFLQGRAPSPLTRRIAGSCAGDLGK